MAAAREKVLAAAEELFFRQGFEATTVRQIVDAAGVTTGAVYHHFASKEDLLYELYMEVFRENLAGLDRIVGAGEDPEHTLRAIIDDLVVTTARGVRSMSVAAHEMSRLATTDRWADLQVRWRGYQDRVRQVIRDGQEAGLFTASTSPAVVSWSIFGFTNELHSWYRPDGPKTARELAAELADFVLAGLGAGEQR